MCDVIRLTCWLAEYHYNFNIASTSLCGKAISTSHLFNKLSHQLDFVQYLLNMYLGVQAFLYFIIQLLYSFLIFPSSLVIDFLARFSEILHIKITAKDGHFLDKYQLIKNAIL